MRFTPALLLTTVLLALGGCGSLSGTDQSKATEATTAIPVQQRKPLGALRGVTLTGAAFDSAAVAGSVTVYNVWGSWCPPCRAEAPVLRTVWQENRDRGVRFMGIDTRDTRASALAFERRFGIGYPSFFDPDGELLLAFRGFVPPSAIPSTIVVDRAGRVAARILGATTYARLTAIVGQLLAE